MSFKDTSKFNAGFTEPDHGSSILRRVLIREQESSIGYVRSLLAGAANKIEAGKTENLVAEIREYLKRTSPDTFSCKARAQNTGHHDPAECDWPVCGCDPSANKVIDALLERGSLISMGVPLPVNKIDRLEVENERKAIAEETRRYASHYPPHSDGRNTFVMLADWIDGRALLPKDGTR